MESKKPRQQRKQKKLRRKNYQPYHQIYYQKSPVCYGRAHPLDRIKGDGIISCG